MIRKTWMCALLSLGMLVGAARAQSEASAALSLMPVASAFVASGASGAASATAGAVAAPTD